MNETSIKLDEISIHIEETINILKCFVDFCENEGFINENETAEKEMIISVCFTRRLEQYKTLLYTALSSLSATKNNIKIIVEQSRLRTKN